MIEGALNAIGKLMTFLYWVAGLSLVALVVLVAYMLFFQETAADVISDAAQRCQSAAQASIDTKRAQQCTVELTLIFQDREVKVYSWGTD